MEGFPDLKHNVTSVGKDVLFLTGVLPADVLQVELRIIGHVLLNPRPAVNLLIRGRNDEETGDRTG